MIKANTLQFILGISFFVLFGLGLIFKINSSSLGMWDYYLGGSRAEVKGVIAGAPKGIRSDEWMLGVPWILSQANSNPAFPTENLSVGAATSPLLVGLPTNHWTGIFRPAQWGYSFFSIERGFSWYWLVRTLGVFSILFLFFCFALRTSFLIAAVGASWIYFSGFNQWWLASVSEVLFAFFLSCVSFAALFQSKTVLQYFCSALLLLLGAVGFGLTLYPPFQIPLFYLGLTLIPFLVHNSEEGTKTNVWIKIETLGVITLFAGLILFLYVDANKEAVSIMQATVYPGQRLTLGGGYDFLRYFSGIFDSAYTEGNFPLAYGNVCEASSFLLLWPISFGILFFNSCTRNALKFAPLVMYLVFCTVWVVWGGNVQIAKWTLWSMVPSNRALIGLGLGSIIFCILVLSAVSKPFRIGSIAISLLGLLALGAISFKFYAIWHPDPSTYAFILAAGCAGIIIVGLAFSAPVLMFLGVIAGIIYPHATINPIMMGMDSILKSELYQAVQTFDVDKSEKWAVYGSPIVPQIVKATGAKVINGSLYIPDFASLEKLDPDRSEQQIYNRYAHVTFNQLPEGAESKFHLLQPDSWQLDISPCDQAFKELGIRYFVFMPRRRSLEYSCLEVVFKGRNFSIFKRTDL